MDKKLSKLIDKLFDILGDASEVLSDIEERLNTESDKETK